MYVCSEMKRGFTTKQNKNTHSQSEREREREFIVNECIKGYEDWEMDEDSMMEMKHINIIVTIGRERRRRKGIMIIK